MSRVSSCMRVTAALLVALMEEAVRPALANPDVMIISDGNLKRYGHPRGSGTFARVLGRYVRQEKVLSLMDALRKMTLVPAQRLEARVPAMKKKGRVQVGADADLTIFGPERVRDRATFAEPALPSEGIEYVLVHGVVVVRDGELQQGVTPGRPVRAPGP